MVAIFAGAGAGLDRSSIRLLGSQGQIGDASLGRSGLSAYVNAATGGLDLEAVDEILLGKGPDEVLKTQYDSALIGTGAQSWFSTAANAVYNLTGTVNTAGSTITHVNEFNDWQVLTYDTSRGAYVFKGEAGAYDEIRFDGSVWSFKDGNTQRVDYFEHAWNYGILFRSRSVDCDGNTQSFTYDANGCVTRITNADGSYTEINGYVNYKPSDVKTTYVNAQGVTTSLTRIHYVWDSSGRLLSTVVDLSPEDSLTSDGNTYATNYTYDGSSARIASITQTDGSRLDITYDGSGRVATYTQTVAAGVTRTTSFDYSVAGRTTVTDPAGQKTILFYDASKNLTQITYPAIDANSTPRVVQFAYNANGDVTSVTNGPGDVTTYDYDANGNRILERDSAGNTIKRSYGGKNELLTETRYLVPDPDGAGSGQPSTPLTTRYAYDAENHLRYVVSAEGMVTRYDYNAPGQQIAAIDYTGNTYSLAGLADNVSIAESALDGWSNGLADKTLAQRTETSYDYRGNVATITSYSKLLSTGLFDTSSELSQTTYVYDSYGNLLSRQTNASTASEVFVYDGMGRQTMATDFNGAVTRSYFLDTRGQTVLTHANGLSEVSTYDRAGELTSFSQSNAGGNLVDLTGWPGNPGSVPSGHATLPGWLNYFTDETQWMATTGPDGLPVVAIRAGQTVTDDPGGGNYTHEVAIDGAKAYEFTYYFKLSDLDKHYVYFGLGTSGAANVERLSTGVVDSNPYFFIAVPGTEAATFGADKWYKVVGYVLPQGSPLSSAPLGGVYDVATGQKVADNTYNFRWKDGAPPGTAYTRFFDYYGDTSWGYSTYFYQPEIRQVSTPTVTGPDRSTSLYRYDNLGRLRMTVDPTGRRQYMMYDNVGRKAADIDADGSVTEYRYDGSDNVTSTTRYANKLSSGQLASLVDSNGNPTSATFASLRPSTNAEDQWTWQVYDAAQRLIQTVDGTGATSVYTYDGASRVTATKTFANRLSSTTLASLKAEASSPNFWLNPTNGALWSQGNLSVTAAGTIDGANAFQFSTVTGYQWEGFSGGGISVSAGDTVTSTISIKAVGSVTTDAFGLWGGITGWDPGAASTTAQIVSGPGTIASTYGGLWYFQNLSTTEATRVEVTRIFSQAESIVACFYVNTSDGTVPAGNSAIVAAPVVTRRNSTAVNLPTADAANDRVSRSFYDADDRLIATMDAAGGLSQIVYDQAGRKVRELGSAKAVTQSLRAAGTLAQLISDVGTSASDRRADYVYDARGFLRYTLDATAKPVETVYDGAGRVLHTVDYAGNITAASTYSLAYVQAQLAATGLSTSTSNRITRTVYDADGRAAFTIDAAGTVYAFTYDNVGNVIKQAGYATAYTTAGDQSLATMQSWAASHAADPGNRFSRSIYDVHGRVAYTVDAEGYIVEHRYDAAGRVVKDISYADVYSVSDGVTKESLAAQIGTLPSTAVVVSYAYDADGLLSDVTDGVGAVTRYAHDAFGQLTDTIVAYGTADASTLRRTYDSVGRVAGETAAYGTAVAATTSYTYDAIGNVVTVTDPRGYVTTRTYDMVGRTLTVTVPVDSSSANDLVTVNQYDAFGDLVKVTDPRGNEIFNYYDALGRVILQSDAEGFITQTSYTAFSQVYQVTRRAARGTGTPTVTAPPTVVTGSGDATTTFAYDKMGQLATVTDAEGFSENYYYDAFGERYAVYNKLGAPTSYGYDRLGRLYYERDYVPVYRPDGTVQASSNYTSLFNYDSQRHVVLKAEAYGLSERRNTYYTYDKAGRVVTVAHDAVQVVGSDLSTTSTVTPSESYTYNLRGDLIQSVDADGGKTLSWYDALGRKTDEVSAVGTLSHWTYDGNGNVLTARIYGDAVAIPGTPGGSAPAPVNANSYRETSYSYDRANRLTGTTIAPLRVGLFSGGAYVTSYGASLSTQAVYDKNGNVVGEIDRAGNGAWTYYDALGRKVAQVDRENFLTAWTLDANGNALSETRYANKIGSTVDYSTPVASLLAAVGTNAADRTTTFTYDRNGRRLTETRLGVSASAVSGTGVLSTSTLDATITYTYNPLGLVTSKTEANGDLTTYIYDTSGRLVTTKGAAITDYAGTAVRPETDYFYDGLGDVVRTVLHGDVYSSATDRITVSAYGAGGRLAATTDASGFVRNYAYDAAGRVVKESWTRLKSDGTTSVTEAIGYRYDLAGRLVTQASAAWNGSSFVFGDATRIRYDVLGEVTGRGITAGPNVTAVYQETFDYDGGGRVWRSTAGDGATKLIYYDKTDNATLTVSSTGADLSAYTIDAVMASLTSAGGTTIANAVTTIAVFDKRGQQTQSREPDRQLTASTSATITTSSVYNAFGEVTSETDARGNATTYSYNAMGRLTQKVSPIVSWTGENGTAHTTDHPTENYYYDISGRLVSVQDANGNYTTRLLLAGTGQGGTDPLVRAEYHSDGGIARTFYDAFGDARLIRNETYDSASTTYHASSDEQRTYDKMGRVVSVVHTGNLLTDTYTYDGLGERIRHYNSLLGSSAVERTDYDAQGRVTRQFDMAGTETDIAYSWNASGIGYWTKATTDASAHTSYENNDYFGRLTGKTDFGGHISSYTYDLGGRLTQESGGGGQVMNYTWFNTGNLYQAADTVGTGMNAITATYGYDAAGNRTYEGYSGTVYSVYYGGSTTSATLTLQNATIAYDALGRIISFTDKDASNATRITVTNEYDLGGNVRRTTSTYPELVHPEYGNITQDKWYRYDSMNRMVVADGQLVSGAIVRGTQGEDITYDAASRRRTQTKNAGLTGYANTWVWYEGHGPGSGHLDEPMDTETGYSGYVAATYSGARQEQYSYGDDGELATVKFAETGYTDNGDGTVSSTGTFGSAVLRAQYDRDAAGRIAEYQEFDSDGTTVTRDRYSIAYDARNNIIHEYVSQKKVESGVPNTYLTYTDNHYTTDGRLSWSTAQESKNGSDSAVPDTRIDYSYAWYDGARVSSTSFDGDTGTTSNTIFTSTYYYDALGRVGSVDIADGRRRTVSFAYTSEGQVLNRKERSSATANPEDQHYFVAGAQYGELTNNGNYDPELQDYAQSLVMRNWTPNPAGAAFRWTASGGATNGIFGPAGYQALNPMGDGTASSDSGYTVRAGETLQSIAAGVWGDASLWYLIADANGMSGGESLAAGTSLILPDRVTNVHNSANTFRVYDPNRALGDLNPTNAKPPKKAGGCAVVGQILLTVIAVAVSIYTAGALSALGPVLAGAIGGAAGSVVSQGVGIATGLQQGFDFKGVALGALGGAVGGALAPGGAFGNAGAFGKVGSSFAQGALRGAAGSLLTQGIAVATGLQDKFSWSGIAGAALGGGISNAVTRGLVPSMKTGAISSAMANGASSAVGAFANAGARSLIDGTDFGDNLLAALPDVIGSTIGNWLSGVGKGSGSRGTSEDEPATKAASAPPISAPNAAITTESTNESDAYDRYWLDPNERAPGSTDSSLGTCPDNEQGQCVPVQQANLAGQNQQQVMSAWMAQEMVWDSRHVPPGQRAGLEARWQATWQSAPTSETLSDPAIAQAFYDRDHPGEASWAGTENVAAGVFHFGRDALWLNPVTGPFIVGRGIYNLGTRWSDYQTEVSLGMRNPFVDGWNLATDAWNGLTRMSYVHAIGGTQGFLRQYGEPVGYNGAAFLATGAAGRVAFAAEAEGLVYSRIDLNGDLLPYGGQAQSYERFLERQIEHNRDHPNADFDFTIVDRANPGVDLDIAEHRYIQGLTGGVRASRSPLVSNLRDPVGPARRPALGLPEPRGH